MHRPTTQSTASTRIHALDAVRAIALLLGIVLHAAMSFIAGLDETIWPVRDVEQSVGPAVISFVIHVFRMSVFFLVAGLLARMLLHRRGVEGFVRNRLQRIAVPIAVFWPLCFIASAGVVMWMLVRRNGGVLPERMPEGMEKGAISWMHLWFLWMLLWIYGVVLLLRALVLRIDPLGHGRARLDRIFGRLLDSLLAPLLLALPVALGLFATPEWVRFEGVRTPGYTLVPPWQVLFINTYVFLLGWMLDRQRGLLGVLQRRAIVNVALGGVATVLALVLVASDISKLHYAAWYALALTSTTLGAIGLGMRFFQKESTVVRYLSDASYWMYIAHLPLVIAAQAALMSVPLHWSIKLLVVTIVTFALLLLAYRYAVRGTWIGAMLSGSRRGNLRRAATIGETT